VLWLGDGIEGDDTDGHVDDLSRFTDPHTVVTVVEEDPQDKNHGPLKDNLERLRGMRDQDGQPFRVVTLPMPKAMWVEDQRLPASYEFHIANNVVDAAVRPPDIRPTLEDLFPPPIHGINRWISLGAHSTASRSNGQHRLGATPPAPPAPSTRTTQ
jgi:agmatine deiminase